MRHRKNIFGGGGGGFGKNGRMTPVTSSEQKVGNAVKGRGCSSGGTGKKTRRPSEEGQIRKGGAGRTHATAQGNGTEKRRVRNPSKERKKYSLGENTAKKHVSPIPGSGKGRESHHPLSCN